MPNATYRLQMQANFGFNEAKSLLPYFARLGIDTLYLSPILKARKNSPHGYDIVDFSKINPEIGSEYDFERFAKDAKREGFKLILDIVPNHMCIAADENKWWWDILKRGKNSSFAKYFDIDWSKKVVIPILDEPLKKALNTLQIQGNHLIYKGMRFPLNISQNINQQPYKLLEWRKANEKINYRRFFDINDLAGLRIEDRDVFKDVHEKIFKWIKKGCIQGLRIDHIDGLKDPTKYLLRLREQYKGYIVVEKILVGKERLSKDWPIQGTTGYDFLNLLNGVFVNLFSHEKILHFYKTFTQQSLSVAKTIDSSKVFIMNKVFQAEINFLTQKLLELESNFTKKKIQNALKSFIASLSIYRTYIQKKKVRDFDKKVILQAVKKTRKNFQDKRALNFLKALLLNQKTTIPSQKQEEFVMRLQQTTGAVFAKGVEDTALYRVFPLASLNEVGADLLRFGSTVAEFHSDNCYRQKQMPSSLLATTTHDTKRGEDLRARLSVVSEIPDAFSQAIIRWHTSNKKFKEKIRGKWTPDKNTEYLIYQTLIGTFPLERKITPDYTTRIAQYITKAVREAKQKTNWIDPNLDFESATTTFIQKILKPQLASDFIADFQNFISPIITCGMYNSLSQLLLKTTSVGVADFYQGCELWNDSLVDPDNRRIVDYQIRKKLLNKMLIESENPEMFIKKSLQKPNDGKIKLYLMHKLLKARKKNPKLFTLGSYAPCQVTGARKEHVIAFKRADKTHLFITIASRFFYSLLSRKALGKNSWGGTRIFLPKGMYYDHFTQQELKVASESLSLSEVFTSLPLAFLERIL